MSPVKQNFTIENFEQELMAVARDQGEKPHDMIPMVVLCLTSGRTLTGYFFGPVLTADKFCFEGSLDSRLPEDFTVFTIRCSAVAAWSKLKE